MIKFQYEIIDRVVHYKIFRDGCFLDQSFHSSNSYGNDALASSLQQEAIRYLELVHLTQFSDEEKESFYTFFLKGTGKVMEIEETIVLCLENLGGYSDLEKLTDVVNDTIHREHGQDVCDVSQNYVLTEVRKKKNIVISEFAYQGKDCVLLYFSK